MKLHSIKFKREHINGFRKNPTVFVEVYFELNGQFFDGVLCKDGSLNRNKKYITHFDYSYSFVNDKNIYIQGYGYDSKEVIDLFLNKYGMAVDWDNKRNKEEVMKNRLDAYNKLIQSEKLSFDKLKKLLNDIEEDPFFEIINEDLANRIANTKKGQMAKLLSVCKDEGEFRSLINFCKGLK